MCIMSRVMDHYKGQFPAPTFTVDPSWYKVQQPSINADELRVLIDEFKQAVAAAKLLDHTLKQPDCVDPAKADLEKRVAAIERALGQA